MDRSPLDHPSGIQETIRSEMSQVLAEMASNTRREEEYSSRRQAVGRPHDEVQMLKERIGTLEDALAKSEADRSAVYAKHEAAVRALNAANEEKTAILHEYHDNTMGIEAMHQHRNEIEALKAQMRTMGEQYEQQMQLLVMKLQEKDQHIKKLKKATKSREDKVDGVSLADLHYSNERLSAQLAKLQTPAPAVYDEHKVAACESAVSTLTTELAALESRMKQQMAQHSAERQNLMERMEANRRDFDIERAECDRVVGMMSAKLEALISENNFLRSQVAAHGEAAANASHQRPSYHW